ncbi:MAG: aldo/keto reductase [Deltaproteobacteria bacterium]|jgi:predicted aldo/keto reductase-like oxidoreductase|nr:aldo/keto reductase [Deltaproteobacteria bacterium]
MEKRDLGLGPTSLLGFGLMRLPVTGGPSEIDKPKAMAMVDEAIAGGVNYFDTAWMYHAGESENFAGEALSRHDRSKWLLADKMPLMSITRKSDVDRIFSEQLRKCRVDYFDFYLLHGIMGNNVGLIDGLGIYENLGRKRERGLIRHLGFSFHDSPAVLERVVSAHDYEFGQLQLNYYDWENQDAAEQYRILAERKIPVMVMEPVQGGTLADPGEEAVGILRAADPEASPASWAFRYAASLPYVQTVLSGMGEMSQLRDNLGTFSPFRPLSDGERRTVSEALTAFRKASRVPCTACRYCMDCPEGVEIPRNLGIYNDYSRMRSLKHPMADLLLKMEYGLLAEPQRAGSCVSCGNCVPLCPQHIDIPHWMGEVARDHRALSMPPAEGPAIGKDRD